MHVRHVCLAWHSSSLDEQFAAAEQLVQFLRTFTYSGTRTQTNTTGHPKGGIPSNGPNAPVGSGTSGTDRALIGRQATGETSTARALLGGPQMERTGEGPDVRWGQRECEGEHVAGQEQRTGTREGAACPEQSVSTPFSELIDRESYLLTSHLFPSLDLATVTPPWMGRHCLVGEGANNVG